MKVETEDVQRDIAELTSSKEAKSKETEASNADLQSAINVFDEATKLVEEANVVKLENDKGMAEVLKPARMRKADAIKEKEQLAGEVVALQKEIEQAQNINKDTITNSEAKLLTKSNELKEEKAKLEKARTEFEELVKSDAASHDALLKEQKEYQDFATKFEAATKAEIDSLEGQKTARVDARVAQLEARRSALDLLEDRLSGDIENLKANALFLQQMKDVKKRIQEAPLLDESGEEFTLDGDEYGFEVVDDNASVDNEVGGSPVKPRLSRVD